MLFASQSKLFLNKISEKYNMILKSEKCKVVISKFERNILSVNKIADILDKKVEFTLCYSSHLIKRLNGNNLNISESKYENDVSHLVNKLFDSYGIKVKNEFSLSNLLKNKNHKEDVTNDVKIIR